MSQPVANFGCRVGRQYPAPALQKRMYAAAKSSRLTGGWHPVDQNINQLISSSGPAVRARTRQLVRDFPYFQRAKSIHIDYTVGAQMNFQARVRDIKDNKLFNVKVNQQIEDAVSWAMDEIDVSGKQHYNEMRQLLKGQDIETGEGILVKTNMRDANRYIPFGLQILEADWLTDLHCKVANGNKVDQGVEFNLKTCRVIAYHFADPENIRAPRRILAEDVLHGFEMLRPGQLRGISPFTTAILIANDLNDYVGSTIDTAKLASRYLALVTTNNPELFQKLRTLDGTDEDEGKKLEELENAIIEYLRPGESIEFAKQEAVGQTFDPFTRFILRMLSIATGTSFELLTNDYSGLNYSSLKMIRADLVRQFKRPFLRHVRHFDQPIVRTIIDQAVLAGRIDLPGYMNNPYPYWAAEFIQPGVESPDRLRDSKADTTEIANRTRSPQEIVSARGRDYGTVLDEIAEAERMAEERGLTQEQVSTALANNPAKLGAEEEGETNAKKK